MPGEDFLALEAHGNGEAHDGAFGQAHEIDMDGTVADRIELHLARNDAGLLAGDVEHEEGRQERAGQRVALQQHGGRRATFSGASPPP